MTQQLLVLKTPRRLAARKMFEEHSCGITDRVEIALVARGNTQRRGKSAPAPINPPRETIDRAAFHPPEKPGHRAKPIGQPATSPVHKGQRKNTLAFH